MPLIDSHCHLDFPEFDGDRQVLIELCKQQGISQFIVPGISHATWPRLDKFARRYPECRPAFGLHPFFIDEHQLSHVDVLKKRLKTQRPIAIGEIGLDYYLKTLDRKKQQAIFCAQLILANEFNLPVILHVRKAHDDVIFALKKHQIETGIVHAFNGSFQQASQYIDLGFKLGFGGALTFDNAHHLKKLAQKLPLKAIVLETDSPDMRPANYCSVRNTPLTVKAVFQMLSSLREESGDEIARLTYLNTVNALRI